MLKDLSTTQLIKYHRLNGRHLVLSINGFFTTPRSLGGKPSLAHAELTNLAVLQTLSTSANRWGGLRYLYRFIDTLSSADYNFAAFIIVAHKEPRNTSLSTGTY